MFERNRTDNSPEPLAVPCEVTLVDGDVIKGKLFVSASRPLAEHLNGPGGFLEIEPYGGERLWLAKGQIATLKPVGVPKAMGLGVRSRSDDFDPYAILGVAQGCSWDEVRDAYVKLSKTYHPDRFASSDLPSEVCDYLATMARRINAARDALDAPRQVVRRNGAQTSSPIYTSQPRR